MPSQHSSDPRPAVELDNVSRTFRARRRRRSTATTERHALDSVSLDIHTGEWVALLGPNGSGKSTLIAIAATLDHAFQGSVRLFGRTDRTNARNKLGVVFQQPALDALLTVRENLRLAAALHDADPAAVEPLADSLAIADRLDDRVGTLSGGLTRRVDLARAMLHQPELLILDEATSGLDLNARAIFFDMLDATRAWASPPAILLATHAMDEAERCDRVVLMDRGHIVANDTPANLRAQLGSAIITCRAPTHAAAFNTAVQAAAPSAPAIVGPPPSGRSTGAAGEEGRASHAPAQPNVRAAVILTDHTNTDQLTATLVRQGIPFEYGPPTLADVYTAATGRSLDQDTPEGNDHA